MRTLDGDAEADGRHGWRTEPQRQMEDADGGQSRSGRWKTRMEDKAAEADGRHGWRTEPQRQMEDADGGQSRSGRWEPRRVIAAISLAIQEMMVMGQECTC